VLRFELSIQLGISLKISTHQDSCKSGAHVSSRSIFSPFIHCFLLETDWKDLLPHASMISFWSIRYFKNEKATTESILDGGWFATGDSVESRVMSDGITHFFKILGRSSVDILKCGGYKISALEIERVMLELSGLVREAVVVGLPDEVFGNCIVGLVVPCDESSHEDIRNAIFEHCKSSLAPYKIPREIHIVPSIEKNAMGKVNKKELCARLRPSIG
jgi:acyl-CoA synthetase (AMP-forming)/AMP-acid ligase II